MSNLKEEYLFLQNKMQLDFIFKTIKNDKSSYSQEELVFMNNLIEQYTSNDMEKRLSLFQKYLELLNDIIDNETGEDLTPISPQWNEMILKDIPLDTIQNNQEIRLNICKLFKNAKSYYSLESTEDFFLHVFEKNYLREVDYVRIINVCVQEIFQNQEDDKVNSLLKYIIDNKKVILKEQDINKLCLNIFLNEAHVFNKFFMNIMYKENVVHELKPLITFLKIFNPDYETNFKNCLKENWVLEHFFPNLDINAVGHIYVNSIEQKETAFIRVAQTQKISEANLKKMFFNQKTIDKINKIDIENVGHYKHARPIDCLQNYLDIYNSVALNLNYQSMEIKSTKNLEEIKNQYYKLFLETIIKEQETPTKKIKL